MSVIAEKYIDDILSGHIPAGPWIIKAFQRHRRDLENVSKHGFFFDPESGDRVIEFIESFCIPSDNDGKLMVLTAWQHAVLYILYGWKKANGYRRFRRLYLEIAKKNGKTALAAALLLYQLIADDESSPRVFCAATTNKQARKCFEEAAAMVDNNPELSAAIKRSGKEKILALYTSNLGRASCMSRDSASEDGALVSCAILDELHHWKTGTKLYSVLRYGGRTRQQPLLVEITTAGASAGGTSLCWNEREYGTKILDGLHIDDEFCPFIFSLDDKDDWKESGNWVKANPSLGYLFDIETIQKEFNEAQGKPTELGDFKRFCLNIWSNESENPAIDIDKWNACCVEDIATHPDPRRLRKDLEEKLKGRICFGGIDLAPKLDTSSLVLLFPPITEGEKWHILEFFWCPKDNVDERVKRDRVHYDTWADHKFITRTPGNMTDVRFIADALIDLSKQYDIKQIFYDPNWSSELIRMLGETDYPLHQKFAEFAQSHARMNAPCIEFMRKALRQEFAHGNNPVMRWQMSNLKWNVQKNTGFIRPARSTKREKIDGCAALLMALACATSPENQIKPKKKLWVVQSKPEERQLTDLEKQFPGVTFD